MSKLGDIVNSVFRRGTRFYKGYGVSFGGLKLSTHSFADVIFYNGVGLLTDLCNDVTWKFAKGKESLSSAFVRFYNKSARLTLYRLFREGYVVIAHEGVGIGQARADHFRFAETTEYNKETDHNIVKIIPTKSTSDKGIDLYVIVSSVYEATGKSHLQLGNSFMVYLDNALNASNTILERLGAMVVASPAGTQNTFGRLNETEKKEIEAEIQKEYGSLAQQSQFLLLPKEMNMQVVSLASLDLKTQERVRTSVLAIADLLNVPANQIGLIDAESSKALSNGSELIAGDLAKYKSFERLLNETFVQMAIDLGLQPGSTEMIDGVETPVYYGIYNKPKENSNEGIS